MKDNFSVQSDLYARYRPAYPPQLYEFILQHVKQKDAVWDCATGNGQAAKELSRHFKKVFATDISTSQIENAYRAKNIFYSIQPAEKTNFPDSLFDLVTVATGIHWFRFDEFYNEVKRTAKSTAWLAAWSYSLLHVSKEIDKIIQHYHFETIAAYWDKERKYVDEKYLTIPFPFNEIKTPPFQIEVLWSIDDLAGYLNTWSALQNFIKANQYNPVPELIKTIKTCWGMQEKRMITFPLSLRFGRVLG